MAAGLFGIAGMSVVAVDWISSLVEIEGSVLSYELHVKY